ncbi:MAG: hypothetical protein KIT84_42840 [Labilithrix sp.]|nr:hypothetical protein [Labilithrix sp.]MCW5817816.1 hypothetical protein [Labilithrix sp.]
MKGGQLAIVIAFLALGSCKELDPETGDLRATCSDADSNPAVAVDFARDIRPLIDGDVDGTRGCIGCHSSTSGSMEGFVATGLDLSKLQALRQGGRSTPPNLIVVPGKPCDSAIVQKLEGTFTGARMPRGGPFWDATKIQLVRDWIAEGAAGADE